jgi:Uma2 family endonuclease
MSAHAQSRLSEDEYLALDRAAEFKSELYDGAMYAMSGGSYRHGQVILNLGAELRQALRGRQCSVTASEVRVRLNLGSYAYPDISVVCGELRFADDQKDTLVNPTVLIEVLSPSTESHDRGLKFIRYRQLESLQEYALVSQSEPRVEIFRRQPSGSWLLSEFTALDSAANFDSLDCKIPLAEIYHQVAFVE